MSVKFLTSNNADLLLKGKIIYIFGSGGLGKSIGSKLQNLGLEVKYAVDDAYYNNEENAVRFSNIPQNDNTAIIYGVGSINRFNDFKHDISGDFYIWWNMGFEFDESFMKSHVEDFKYAESLLQDKLSKDIFKNYIDAKRLNGNMKEFEYCSYGTYFNDLTNNPSEGVFIDCGAYTGDSVEKYLKFVGNSNAKVIAFEPDPVNFKELSKVCVKYKNVRCLNLGLWNKTTELHFSASMGEGSHISEDGDTSIKVCAIDDIVKDKKICFIKMDVEGAEREALIGAEKTIKRNLPILAISAYHLKDDLYVLPKIIKEINPDYKLYLRHHSPTNAELVLYAIA